MSSWRNPTPNSLFSRKRCSYIFLGEVLVGKLLTNVVPISNPTTRTLSFDGVARKTTTMLFFVLLSTLDPILDDAFPDPSTCICEKSNSRKNQWVRTFQSIITSFAVVPFRIPKSSRPRNCHLNVFFYKQYFPIVVVAGSLLSRYARSIAFYYSIVCYDRSSKIAIYFR